MNWLNISEGIKNFGEAAAILAGGGWAYYKFVYQREKYSRTELDVGLNILGNQQNYLVVELTATCHNKGSVREKVYADDFTFSLFILSRNDEVKKGDEKILNQLEFKKYIDNQKWVPKKWEYTFFDPGVELRYSHVTALPMETAFALLQTRFFVKEKQTHFNTAQKTFSIDNRG